MAGRSRRLRTAAIPPVSWLAHMNVFSGLSKLPNLLNIRYERLDPARMKTWTVAPEGLRIALDGRAVESVGWDDLAEIVVFKRDYGASDQICLGLRKEESGDYAVLEEDNPSWPAV